TDDEVQPFAQIRHRRLRKAHAAKLLGDACHLACRNPVDHHLHQRQHQRLLAPLIPLKELRRKLTLTDLGHPQGKGADTGHQLPRLIAVAVAPALLRPLSSRCASRIWLSTCCSSSASPRSLPETSLCKTASSTVTWYWVIALTP